MRVEGSKKILILDDEPNMRHMLTMMLEKAGYKVRSGADGQEGLDLLQHRQFDFILCDIKMPRMTGMDFLKASVDRRGEATVIMMSAYGTLDIAIGKI
jgi:two-component system response regulator AtoC